MFLFSRASLILASLLTCSAMAGCGRTAPASPGLTIRYGTSNRLPSFLVVIDSQLAVLDTAAAVRLHAARVLQTLDGRAIDSVRFIPPDSAIARYGSRASAGVLRVWVRPSAP